MNFAPLVVLLCCGVKYDRETVVVEPRSGFARASLIFLHGLGDSARNVAAVAQQRLRSELPNTRFVFPNAPRRPITINGGARMAAWYDIDSLEGLMQGRDDVRGFNASASIMLRLARAQLRSGVARVALGGFSQGAYLPVGWEKDTGIQGY